ncbi:hypothetical protein [Halobacterium salinarum]|uniref:hypothetical protein n=1 Tax=Halobacterium salinarum TaxID=2242 RepID=UPI002552BE89|nr:hypothetical protein [Halobacterium salinarum]MDL0126651.1 hypothetical protein [Halobacterium salinarum]
MPRDIAPLTRALEDTTPGDQRDVYSLLAAWNQSIETALERGGGSRFREVMGQYLEEVIDLIDAAATNDEIDWTLLEDCVDAYPPGVGDHHCSSVLANVVARCVIRTRIRDGVEEIPAWTLEYLASITMDGDGDWAWESAAAFGWGVGHPDIAVLDRTVERAETGDDWSVLDHLEHVTFADPDSGITLLERLLRSTETVEDLEFLRMLEPLFERDFPNFPEYWEPHIELEYDITFTDDELDRLLRLLGDTVHPDRLRHFDEQFTFDLQRAADEYSSANYD